MQYVLIKSFILFEGLICPCDNGRGVAAYTLSRHGVHIGRLKKNENKIKIKCTVTFNSLIKSVELIYR